MENRAVLLVNLGSPARPDIPALRKYLNQFLMDPYVIQLPWFLRRLIVGLFILPFRPANSTRAYRSIWTPEGSPLIALSTRVLEKVQQATTVPVDLAMRYGEPSIESRLLALAARDGIGEILLIPLYPHYADSTVTTTIEEARRVIGKHRLGVKLIVKAPFYQDSSYIDALYKGAEPWLNRLAGGSRQIHGPAAPGHAETQDPSGQPGPGEFNHIVFSYHGLPESHITRADPTGQHCLKKENCCALPSPALATCYRHQALRTTALLMEKAGLKPEQYTVAFQSRLGRARWLEPTTENVLANLARGGAKNVLVICPAFVTDCLETLEEIAIRGAETFKQAGGETLELIPCLNDHPDWINLLAGWCEEEYTLSLSLSE